MRNKETGAGSGAVRTTARIVKKNKGTVSGEAIRDAELTKEIASGYIKKNKDGSLVIKTKRREVKITENEYSVRAIYSGVKYYIPKPGNKYLKFIVPKPVVQLDGKIRTLPKHWTYGVPIKANTECGEDYVLVTRTFNVKGHPELAEKGIPFGTEVVGSVRICESYNPRTGKTRVIVDHYVHLSPVEASYEVKFGGKERENTVFSIPVPNTNEFVVVNKIGK